jgi:enamine deaminase RidA (YjgF/YER057c/UK114 family)
MLSLVVLTGLSLGASDPGAEEVTRHALLNNNPFPIARAAEIPASATLVFHSGVVPGPLDPDAERGSRAFFGDTEAQSENVFGRLEESLTDLGLGFGDVINMTVFLVGDRELEGRMDFSGFMSAYRRHFGTEAQPNLPTRSVVQIAGLAGGPNMLVEIEVIAVRPAGRQQEDQE